MTNTLTVSELTFDIKKSLEDEFDSLSVVGEISNFKNHFSGHWYFTLKDSDAQVNCTMWKNINNFVQFKPQDGMKVIVNGKLTVYPPRGTYQIDVRSMKPAGEGELQAAFERLKRKLAEEGLFNDEFKKNIPNYPEKIGIVTASDGAAFRDMISVASRRYPLVELVIVPTKVQGIDAAESIASNILSLNKRKDIDLIIVGRGGGSLEDLWCFNEEIVARAIFNSEIPVISAVGHEIDFVISDFVADLRAPTPSAAMELATPKLDDILDFLDDFSYNSYDSVKSNILSLKEYLNTILKSYGFNSQKSLLLNKFQHLDSLVFEIETKINSSFVNRKNKLDLLKLKIDSNDIKHVLSKGFAIVRQHERIIKSVKKLDTKTKFEIQFNDGKMEIN